MGRLLVLLLAVSFWLFAAPQGVFAQNLLKNGGMESGWVCNNAKDCTPGDWSKFTSTIWWQKETFVKHSGSYSVKYSGTNESGKGGSGGHSQTVGVSPGGRYVISGYSYRFYSKSADFVGVRFGSGGIDWYALYGLHGTQYWYRFSIQVDIPAGVNTMTIYLRGTDNPSDLTQTPNDVYFDDLSVDLISVPLKATLSGPASAANGDQLTFIGTANGGTNTISSGGIYVTKLDSNDNPISTDLSWCLSPASQAEGNIWCEIYQESFADNKTTKSFGDTATWTPLMAGNYLVVVNASDSGGRNCGGSPPLPAGWTDCDASGKDTIALTVNCARPNPPTNLSPTGTTIMQPQGLTYTGPTLDWNHTNNIVYPDTVSFKVWVNNLSFGDGSSNCDSTQNGDICGAIANYSLYDDYQFSLGTKYVWWVQAVNSCGGVTSEVVSTTVTIPAYPTISSLQVTNSDPDQTGGFTTGGPNVSGLQASEGGSNWLNPMNITLNASAWNGENNGNNIKRYYVAYYNNTGAAVASNNEDTFISEVTAKLNTNPSEGFLLRYDSNTQTYRAWNPNSSLANKWANLRINNVDQPLTVYNSSGNRRLYTINQRTGTVASWKVDLWKDFGGKTMYTSAFVVDDKYGLTKVIPDINPTQ